MSNKKDVKVIDTVTLRKCISEYVNHVCYGKTRVILTRRGKPVGAIVSMEDISMLEGEKK